MNRKDPTGKFWITVLIVAGVVVCAVGLSGCSAKPFGQINLDELHHDGTHWTGRQLHGTAET